MTIDLAKYEHHRAFTIDWFHTRGGKDIKRTVSIVAAATSVPCIVIAFWLGEETGWHADAISSIKSLKDFYGYTDIQNKPKNSPI